MNTESDNNMFVEQLYIEMFPQLLVYANNALNDYSLAEEAVQDTFKVACVKIEDFISSDNPRGWLTNTLKNVIRNMRRARHRLNSIMVSIIAIDETAMCATPDLENPDLLYSDFAGSRDYALLKQIAVEKYSMVEIAEELGISVEACKKRVQRAKKRLKKIIENNTE